jgi:hypothetical protein
MLYIEPQSRPKEATRTTASAEIAVKRRKNTTNIALTRGDAA